jgi:leucyl-tRNA synthetase
VPSDVLRLVCSRPQFIAQTLQVGIQVLRVAFDRDMIHPGRAGVGLVHTAVAALMKLVNALSGQKAASTQADVETLVKLLAPFAPHLAEELFATCFALPAGIGTVAKLPWPSYDPAKTFVKRQIVILQVNGKVRGKLEVDAGADASEVETLAKQDQTVANHLMGKQLRQVFHVNKVQSRLVSFLTD